MARFVGVPSATGSGSVVASVRILGVPQLLAKLAQVKSLAALGLGALTYHAAQRMVTIAKSLVPIETGNLQSGIAMAKVGVYSWQVSASSTQGTKPEKNWYEYADFVEFGTSNMDARPFMRPAYSQVQPTVRAEIVALARKLQSL